MSASFGVLGQSVPVAAGYDPGLLFPIERSAYPMSRRAEVLGEDVWNGYELSWLSPEGLAQQAWLQLRVNAQSTHIIESKSLKLYLNAFNAERITQTELSNTIERDLTMQLGGYVTVRIAPLSALPKSEKPRGLDVSNQSQAALRMAGEWLTQSNSADAELLQQLCPHASVGIADEAGTHQYVYERFRSLCPVTAQPDWATIIIQQQGAEINSVALLAYLESFRNHQDFHEHCVESIFDCLQSTFHPQQLAVQALFSRRGGLDINPFRSSCQQLKPFLERAYIQ